ADHLLIRGLTPVRTGLAVGRGVPLVQGVLSAPFEQRVLLRGVVRVRRGTGGGVVVGTHLPRLASSPPDCILTRDRAFPVRLMRSGTARRVGVASGFHP